MELIFIWLLTTYFRQFSRGAETALPSLLLFGGLYIFQKIVAICHANHFLDEYIPEIDGVKPLANL